MRIFPELPLRPARAIFLVPVLVLAAERESTAFEPESLPQVGCHPDGISYWGSVLFANALHHASSWLEYDTDWGASVPHWNVPQFDGNGYPRYLNPGKKLRTIVFGLHNPANSGVYNGQWIVAWRGSADLRFGGTFVEAKSSCPATGRFRDGRRVYLVQGSTSAPSLTVHDIDPEDPIALIQAWLPDPLDPLNSSLEGKLWHPKLLERISDAEWGVIRTMNLLSTNANPQEDWSDRRLPTHAFMTGVLNPRSPAEGFDGRRSSGIAFEMLVDLSNRTGKDLWICVPHMASDEFATKLARLIRYGSDGVEPYDSPRPDPVWPPLREDLRVFVEYSNEIWSGGDSFPQGNWAAAQAKAHDPPLSKEAWNARRISEIWRIFQEVFGGTDRVVRVAAVWTAVSDSTGKLLGEIRSFGPTLSPPVEPDAIAVTTYFGNGIQDWVHEKARLQAGTGDPWFYTGEEFGDPPRPVSLPGDDPYWSGGAIDRHIEEAFAEWRKRLLSGDAREGGGPDAVGIGGGFSAWLRDLARTAFDTPKPIVAYEGGPSIYTDYLDGGDSRDDGITRFMNAMNRRAGMREVYSIHLNMAKSKGLWMHMPFTLSGAWGKYGQWGHLEYSDQDPSSAVKYRLMLDWIAEQGGIRHIDRPLGSIPFFETPHFLSEAEVGRPYASEAHAGGGDGSREIALIGSSLVPGMSANVDSGRLQVQGTPAEIGTSYIYCRVVDEDGDPAWRTFSVRSVARSTDPPATIDFEDRAATVDAAVPEPLDIEGYRFTSFGNTGGKALLLQGVEPRGWNGDWESNVLKSAYWGSSHRLARIDGRPFDLRSVDVAIFQGASLRIRISAPGGLIFERIVDLPEQKKPMTTVELDLVSIEKVEFTWWELSGGRGGGRNGAIDNLLIGGREGPTPVRFLRCDANADGEVDLSDSIFTLFSIFDGTVEPLCEKSIDADDSGSIDISDPIGILGWLFQDWPLPPEPCPACGTDPTADGLSCGTFPPCP